MMVTPDMNRLNEDIRMIMFMPSMLVGDDRLAERLDLIVKNASTTTMEEATVETEFSIPSNAILSEVVIEPELEYTIEMVGPGMVRIRMRLKNLRPAEDFGIQMRLYYDSLMNSPEYRLKAKAAIEINRRKVVQRSVSATVKLD